MLNFEYVHEIAFLYEHLSNQMIYPYRVVLKFSCFSKGLDFTNEIIFYNHEFAYLMILKFLDATDMQNKQKIV